MARRSPAGTDRRSLAPRSRSQLHAGVARACAEPRRRDNGRPSSSSAECDNRRDQWDAPVRVRRRAYCGAGCMCDIVPSRIHVIEVARLPIRAATTTTTTTCTHTRTTHRVSSANLDSRTRRAARLSLRWYHARSPSAARHPSPCTTTRRPPDVLRTTRVR